MVSISLVSATSSVACSPEASMDVEVPSETRSVVTEEAVPLSTVTADSKTEEVTVAMIFQIECQ